MDLLTEPLLSKLRELLNEKIKNEWDNKWYNTFGDYEDFSNIKKRNAFLNELLLDIENVLVRKIKLANAAKILISRDNLRRILNDEKTKFWQDKTRNTIAYYVGYDGWENFVDAYKDKIALKQEVNTSHFEETKEPFVKTTNKQANKWITLSIFSIVILILAIVFIRRGGFTHSSDRVDTQRLTISTLAGSSPHKYPLTLKVYYDLSGIPFKEAQLTIRNEYLQYPDRQVFKIENSTGMFFCMLDTPGIKIINLLADGKLVKSISYVVTTTEEWYACARVKNRDFPNPTNNSSRNFWYGVVQPKNTAQNWITTPFSWRSYLYKTNKVYYPNSYLHFPESEIYHANEAKNIFSRVAFVKVDNFPVNIGNLSIRFRAKRDSILHEECISMALQLFDIDLSQFAFHSDILCNNLNIFFENKRVDMKTGETIGENNSKPAYSPNALLFSNNNLNGILEDFRWHDFEFTLFQGKATIMVDGKLKGEVLFSTVYKDLKTIRFVFEGNGYLDDVVVTNKLTNEVVFADDFNKH